MAVAFDAKAAADSQINPLTASVTVSNMTVGASATALVVLISIGTNGANTTLSSCTGATWNAVPMTLIGTSVQANGLDNCYAFGLASPATGTRNIVATFSGGTFSVETTYIDAVSFSGTDPVTATCFPSANVLTDASTPTGTAYPTSPFSVTTSNGDAVCAVCMSGQSQFMTTTGTLIRTDGAIIGNYSSAYRLAVGGPTTIQFTGGGSNPTCGVAFRIQQPQAVGLPAASAERIPRSRPGLGPISRQAGLLNAALPIQPVVQPVVGGTLPFMGVG